MAMRHTYNEFFGQLDIGAVFKFTTWESKRDDVFMKVASEAPGDGSVIPVCVCIYSNDRSKMGHMEYPSDNLGIVECSWQIKYNPDKQGNKYEV